MSLYTDDNGQPRVHCFSCNANYDIFDLIAIDYNLQDQGEIFSKAYELYGLEVEGARATAVSDFSEDRAPALKLETAPAMQQQKTKQEALTFESAMSLDLNAPIERAHQTLLTSTSQESINALKYLESRGISLELIKKYKIGFTPSGCNALLEDRANHNKNGYLYKYILPYPNHEGGFNYFLSEIEHRDGIHHKYIKIKGLTAPLFNERYLAEPNDVIYVCEGIYDALSVETAGQKAIAFVGVGHQRFLNLCKTYKPQCTFVLSLDNDSTGNSAQEKLKQGLNELKIPYIEAHPKGAKDFNEMLTGDQTKFFAFISDTTAKAISAIERNLHVNSAIETVDLLVSDLKAGKEFECISTGLAPLDKVLEGGFHPELYVLGAMSSMGKSTICLQIGDHIASYGRDVMIFSMEMSARELIAKSASRISFINARKQERYRNSYAELCKEARSHRDILAGYSKNSEDQQRTIKASLEEYREQYAPHVYILEGAGDVTAQTINDTVRRHVKTHKTKPVVIVDYLQILAPMNDKQTEKQNTDRAIGLFKRLSRDLDLCVILISSFNRDNYKNDANMASFKESGGIEYSTDVLLGLQFKGMNAPKTKTEKDFNAEKQKQPRPMELVVLKNRNGMTGARVDLDYYSRFNCFCAPEFLGEEWI